METYNFSKCYVLLFLEYQICTKSKVLSVIHHHQNLIEYTSIYYIKFLKYLWTVHYIYFVDIVLALVEALEQLHNECSKDEDSCPDIKFEKAVCHWATILSTFTSFSEGKRALGQYHLGQLRSCPAVYFFFPNRYFGYIKYVNICKFW
jgi:hypothetical protein